MHPDQAELKFYMAYVQKHMAIVDGGAGVGEMALMFSYVGSRVEAFEPDPRMFRKLKGAFEHHPRGNVFLHELALSDEVGRAALHMYDDRRMGWSTMADRPVEEGGVDVEAEQTKVVETTTVDEHCRSHGINRIGLLKLDVEGSEFPVLRGAQGMMEAGAIDCISMEYGRTWWDAGYTPDDVEAYLTGHGFEMMNVLHGQPAFPGREGPYESRYAIMIAAHEGVVGLVKTIIRFMAETG